MAVIPTREFARRLGKLSRDELVEFVARLWAASGRETTTDGPVVTATSDARCERLLVLSPARFPWLHSVPSTDGPVDRFVAPYLTAERGHPRRLPDAPVVDAEELRQRLLYGVDAEVAEALCLDTLGVPARDGRWATEEADVLGTTRDLVQPDEPPVSRRAALGLLGVGALGATSLALRDRLETEPAAPGLDGPPPTPGAGDGRDPDVDLKFEFEEPDSVRIVHAGDDPFDADRTTIEGTGFPGEPTVRWSTLDRADVETVHPGDELSFSFRPDGEITVVWEGSDGEVVLGEFRGPVAVHRAVVSELGFAFAYDDGTLAVEYTGARAIAPGAVFFRGTGFAGEPERYWPEHAVGGDRLERGETANFGAEPTVTVSAFWDGEWATELVAQFAGPDRPLEPSLDGFRSFGAGLDNAGHVVDDRAPTAEVVELWSAEVDGDVAASPVVADGVVYVGGFEGTFYALDAVDGAELWRFETDSRFGIATPAVATLSETADDDGTGGGRPVVFAGTRQGSVYALDGVTGELRWEFGRPRSVTSSLAAVTDTDHPPTVLVSGTDELTWSLYALDARDGSQLWQRSQRMVQPVSPIPSPTVGDGTVYVGVIDGTFRALDLGSGSEVWSTVPVDTAAPVDTSLLTGTGVVVGTREGTVHAYDPRDGTEHWSTALDVEFLVLPAAAPVGEDGEVVFVSDPEGSLFALGAADGEELWRLDPEWEVYSSPVVVDGDPPVVYVGSEDGSLHGVDASDGTERWTHPMPGPVFSPPAVVDGIVYVGSGEGEVRALADPDAVELAGSPLEALLETSRTRMLEED